MTKNHFTIRLFGLLVFCLSFPIFAKETENPYTAYDLAFKYNTHGDTQNALKLIKELMKSELESDLRANVLYLYGHVLGKLEGRTVDAIRVLEESLRLYQASEKKDFRDYGVYVSSLGLLKHYIESEFYDKADAIVVSLSERPSGYLFSLRGNLAFKRGDYQDAYNLADESLKAYEAEKNKPSIAKALVQRAFYQMLLKGADRQAAMKDTLTAQDRLLKEGDTNHYYYSLANAVLFQRCESGIVPNTTVQLIKANLADQPDFGLESLLDFVLTFDCP